MKILKQKRLNTSESFFKYELADYIEATPKFLSELVSSASSDEIRKALFSSGKASGPDVQSFFMFGSMLKSVNE